MKRDLICILRVFIDALPNFVRNSKFLFYIAKFIFRVPKELFTFREKYDRGEIKDLSIFYLPKSNKDLKRISKDTDVNSFHLREIEKLYKSQSPKSILDAGCGAGYILNKLNSIKPSKTSLGLDFKIINKFDSQVKFIEGDILKNLEVFLDNSFEFVICTHVIEHLSEPERLLQELRRVCSEMLIIICPIERKYKWGMNYHINFYPTKDKFIDFLQGNKSFFQSNYLFYKTYFRLGDLMYIEKFRRE